ncbi:MAG: 50S ribosomal protein L10 [Planctomycetes bacterium]|nr:50S ribosomal protein L10 [Planctomycetota bacterium]
MPNRINKAVISEYQRRLGSSPDFVAVDTVGLSVAQFTDLRRLARDKGVQVLVVKTSLACVALQDAVQPDALRGVLAGSTALIFGGEGLPVAARLVADYGKKTGKLAVRGGLFEKKILTAGEVAKFKDIPDRRTLLAQVLSAVTAPLTGVLGLTQNLLSSPAALAEALAKKQENSAA